VTGGLVAALVVIWIIRVAGLSLGTDAPGRLLYGVTVGPIVEEVIFRGAAFSVIYATASSITKPPPHATLMTHALHAHHVTARLMAVPMASTVLIR
jgi:hypothetical protein